MTHSSTHQPAQPIQRRYPNTPLVGVGTAVFNDDGKVLLVQRGRPPRQGQWGLPGGMLDLGEKLADGARREVWEECAVEVEMGEVIATFEPITKDSEGRVEYHYVVIDFWARYIRGEATAQDDAAAVAWARIDKLDVFHLAPETHEVILKAHQAWVENHDS